MEKAISTNFDQNTETATDLKILVIDDEIALNNEQREDFIHDFNFSATTTEFASSCEEALNILKKNTDIQLCFLDYKLPLNQKASVNYSPTDCQNSGINLIPDMISVNNRIKIIVFSAYVSQTVLQQEANQYSNVNLLGAISKDDSKENIINIVNQARDSLNTYLEQVTQPTNSDNNLTKFNYNSLDSSTRSLVAENAQKIKKLLRRTARDILDIGRYLTEVKNSLDYGQFYSWLETEGDLNPRSAHRFMTVYKRLGSDTVSDLGLLDQFYASALYILSPASVPDTALQETFDLAKSGTKITKDIALAIKNKHIKPKKLSNQTAAEIPENSPKTKNTTDTSPKSPPNSALPQQVLKVLPRQSFWEIAQHLVYCGEPNSSRFREKLPQKIALCLAFPPARDWQPQLLPSDSLNSFFSKYQDLDRQLLLESLDRIIQISTESQDNIAICFIPDSQILHLVHNLGCRGFVADPSYDKCLALVNASQNLSS